MSRVVKESSYSPMLQGVSQQVDHERLPGQVQEQKNMLSDPQTGLRRRPGASMLFTGTHGGNALSHLVATEATIGGVSLHIHVDAAAGTAKLYTASGTPVASLPSPYLVAANRAAIRFANLNDELFILNTEKEPVPQLGTTTGNYSKGFFYVETGAFNKTYKLGVKVNSLPYSVVYTTPDGTGTADAALCTPAAVAEQLRLQLIAAGISASATLSILGQYVFVSGNSGTDTVQVSADDSAVYLVVSGQSRIRQASQLPARLPAEADGYVVAVGDMRYPTYYKYEYSSTSWLESGQVPGISGISNVPVSIVHDGSSYVLDSSNFEARTAGDENSNPQHAFMRNARITGMSAYQGRLVLLSGNMVSMSATNHPRRFFRTTVTSVLDSDPIEIGSGNITSANFAYAVAFNKDLVLFADRVQAVIPSQNTALTPRTAAVVLTGTYNTDMGAHPASSGRTVLFPIPRSSAKFGVLELVPSSSTDSQYTSLDVTAHLPKFFDGGCRFTAASAVSRIVVFAPSGNTKQLVIHEFMWDNESKVQSAWHLWEFQLDVAYAYFYGSELIVCFTRGTRVVMCTINTRATSHGLGFLDLGWAVTLGNAGLGPDVAVLPAALMDMLDGEVVRAVVVGDTAQEVEVSRSGSLLTVLDEIAGEVRVGLDFTSSVVPTRPVIRDYKDRPVLTGKTYLQSAVLHTAYSGPYTVEIEFAPSVDSENIEQGGVLWESPELALGDPPVTEYARTVVPCRVDSKTAHIRLATDSVYELNITQWDYVLTTMRKLTRGY